MYGYVKDILRLWDILLVKNRHLEAKTHTFVVNQNSQFYKSFWLKYFLKYYYGFQHLMLVFWPHALYMDTKALQNWMEDFWLCCEHVALTINRLTEYFSSPLLLCSDVLKVNSSLFCVHCDNERKS